MLPRLYENNLTQASDFVTNGLGSLSDAISVSVHEVLNGEFELVMKYPASGLHASDIVTKRIIEAAVGENSSGVPLAQPFRIYKVQKSMDGQMLTVNAHHISYDLSGHPVAKFTATGISNILTALGTNTLVTSPYTYSTDITNTTSTFTLDAPRSARACLGGMEGSILQQFKCEYKFDYFVVYVLARRGTDTNITIRYGVDLESFVSVKSEEASYNGVLAFWKNEGTVVSSDIQYASGANFPTDKIFILDASSEYDSQPTKATLNSRASAYITANNIGVPYLETVTISFIPLWQTEEYRDVVPLEHAVMGDKVKIVYEGVEYYLRVVETTYDSLLERYTSIVLGNKKSTFSETIKQVVKE